MAVYVNDFATALTCACKDKMDLAIGVALNDSQAVVLFIAPLLVIMGWIAGVGKDRADSMSLDFDGFQAIALIVSASMINYLIMDGKSQW